MAWQDDQGFGSNGYDDYFGGPSDSLAYTGNQADDYHFTDDGGYFESDTR